MHSILTKEKIMKAFELHQPVTFGVVWQDFGMPFALPCPTAEIAVNTAKQINHRRAVIDGSIPQHAEARAVALDATEECFWIDEGGAYSPCDASGAGVPAGDTHVSEAVVDEVVVDIRRRA